MTSEVRHNGTVEQMTMQELAGYLSARYQDWLASGRYTVEPDSDDPEAVQLAADQTHEAIKAKVNEEAAMFDAEGAWLAYCTCGWRGNNPYPSRESAVSSLTYHYVSVGAAE